MAQKKMKNQLYIYTLCPKYVTGLACYNLYIHIRISIIFGNQKAPNFTTLPN